MTFTIEELTEIGSDAFDGHTVERDGLRFRFAIEYDDQGVVEMVNDCDCYGRLGWPVRYGYSDRESRPDGFTGAARKFGPNQAHDAIWWEPYRDGSKVYDGPEEVAFMRDLLIYGFVGCTVTVSRKCDCCDSWSEIGHGALWGIESPLVGKGNYEYIAEVFADLLTEAMEPA